MIAILLMIFCLSYFILWKLGFTRLKIIIISFLIVISLVFLAEFLIEDNAPKDSEIVEISGVEN